MFLAETFCMHSKARHLGLLSKFRTAQAQCSVCPHSLSRELHWAWLALVLKLEQYCDPDLGRLWNLGIH